MNEIIKSNIFKARENFKNYWNNNQSEIIDNCYAISTKLEIFDFLVLYAEVCGFNKLYKLYNQDIQKIVDDIFQHYLKIDDDTYETYRYIMEDINNE